MSKKGTSNLKPAICTKSTVRVNGLTLTHTKKLQVRIAGLTMLALLHPNAKATSGIEFRIRIRM